MLDLKTIAAAALALSMSAGIALAQSAANQDEGGRTFPRPGTTGDAVEMDQSRYDPGVSTETTGSIGDDAGFAERWRAMSPEEQDKVRANCSPMDRDKILYSDSVDSICKSIWAP